MNNLNGLRNEIDEIDEEIIKLIGKRFEAVKKIGEYKKEAGLPALDKKRWGKVLTSKIEQAKNLNLDTELIKNIYELIHKSALKYEKN